MWLGTYCRRHDVVRSLVEVVFRDAFMGILLMLVMYFRLVVPQGNMLQEYEQRSRGGDQCSRASVCEYTTPLSTTRFSISSATHKQR
jgi:hypothetical protein